MNARTDQLFDEARYLAPFERSMLALALLDSVEGDALDEAAVAQVWVSEASRRSASLAQGQSQARPWAEVKARLSAL
jgi:putative addiction module component (TIGR02574 family)